MTIRTHDTPEEEARDIVFLYFCVSSTSVALGILIVEVIFITMDTF